MSKFTLHEINEVLEGHNTSKASIKAYLRECNKGKVSMFQGIKYCTASVAVDTLELKAVWMPKELRGSNKLSELLDYLYKRESVHTILCQPSPKVALSILLKNTYPVARIGITDKPTESRMMFIVRGERLYSTLHELFPPTSEAGILEIVGYGSAGVHLDALSAIYGWKDLIKLCKDSRV